MGTFTLDHSALRGPLGRNLQSHYDLEIEKERLGRRLEREVKVLQAA
ncbi:MAG TPA: hypothetical protein VN673_10585 [Clostridia bacterium]|nr:hypothetical protein [Clostridia bacterium]